MVSFREGSRGLDDRKYVTPAEECLRHENHSLSGVFCKATWDEITCWPPTPAGKVAAQPCPPIFHADFDKSVYKTCGEDGHWSISEFWKGFGHSDYSECIDHVGGLEEVFDLQEQLDNTETTQSDINSTTAIVAVTISTISLMLLLVSIVSVNFIVPRALTQVTHYKMSRHIFPAFIFETLIILLEQIFILCEIHYGPTYKTVTNTRIACESLICIKEYASITTYMWILLQCRHLRNKTKGNQYTGTSMVVYYFVGWGVPVVPTTVWAMTALLGHDVMCWTGYQFETITWVLDASKMATLFGTVLCLLLIVRQLMKGTGIFEKAFTGHERNCSYRRHCYDTIIFSLFVFYEVIVLFLMLLHHHMKTFQNLSEGGGLACIISESSKGAVLTILFCTFNLDIRAMLEIKIRRISRQHLVPSPTDIEENTF